MVSARSGIWTLRYVDEQQTEWILGLLLRTGWQVRMRTRQGQESIYEVTPI